MRMFAIGLLLGFFIALVFVTESDPICFDYLHGEIPVVSSNEVARHFQKKHKHILDEIRKIQSICPESFYGPNFRPIEKDTFLPHSGGIRKDVSYLLTRDAFSLLVMGFSGPAALCWKLKYIEAFNELEAGVVQHLTSLARESGYQQGLTEARALPAAEVERKAAYLDGLREGQRLQKRCDGLSVAARAADYLCKGLTLKDAAQLTGCPASTLRGRLRRIRVAAAALASRSTAAGPAARPCMQQGVLA